MGNGLIIKNKKDLRVEFINKHGKDMPSGLLNFFSSVWCSEEIDESEFRVDSELSIWFTTKRPNEGCGCITPLISMYGGESISMCADSRDDAEEFLKSIGKPLEIVCSISKDDPCLIVVGNTESYLKRDILPSEIIEVNDILYNEGTNRWKFMRSYDE